jgi:hypothetical protein
VASGLRRVPCRDDRLAERPEDDRIDRVARRGQDERTREDGEGTAPRTHLISSDFWGRSDYSDNSSWRFESWRFEARDCGG